MLTRQEAEQQLKTFQVAEGEQRRLSRAARLPRRLRGVARALLGCDASGKALPRGKAHEEAFYAAVDELDELRADDRAQIWRVLFPSIVRHVENAWQLQVKMPYLRGMLRKAFRAPNNPRTTRPIRGAWLGSLLGLAARYEQDVTWFAAWAAFLGWQPPVCLSALLAAAIDGAGSDGEAVFHILCASALGEHEIGIMGRHVTGALLAASRPDGWAFVERLLLAAERQEGLRQAILEAVDLAHPQAFRRMVRLILDRNLVRFSATVRAADVWFGLQFDAENARGVSRVLEAALAFLEDPAARTAALEHGDGQHVYLALWASAYDDAVATVDQAAHLCEDSDLERRFAATFLVAQLGLIGAMGTVGTALDDPDLRVVVAALTAYLPKVDDRLQGTDLFEHLEKAVGGFPKQKKELAPILWPWLRLTADRQVVARLLVESLGSRPAARLEPYLAMMGAYERAGAVDLLAASRTTEARGVLFDLLGDRSAEVRKRAAKSMERYLLTQREAILLEGLLGRKAGDLRESVLRLLLGQPDGAALASAERLLEAPDPLQRLAGLQLLRNLIDAGRGAGDCRACAARYQAGRANLSEAEEELLDRLLDRKRQEPTLDNALGLLDPRQRTRPVAPSLNKAPRARRGDRSLASEAAIACVHSLEALIHEHRSTSIVLPGPSGQQERLVGENRFFIVVPQLDQPPEQDAARLPLREVWEAWWAGRPPALRDPDGMELLRAKVGFNTHWRRSEFLARNPARWLRDSWDALLGPMEVHDVRYRYVLTSILDWLIRLHPPAGAADLLLDAVEYGLGLIPAAEIESSAAGAGTGHQGVAECVFGPAPGVVLHDQPAWRHAPPQEAWLTQARSHRQLCPQSWEARHHLRLWGLLRWIDEPGPALPRSRPKLEEVMAALAAGGATEADVLDHLLGPRSSGNACSRFSNIRLLTGRKPAPIAVQYPVLQDIAARCRRRIVEVELARSDLPTAASEAARQLRSAGGQAVLVRLLKALRDEPFERGYSRSPLDRPAVLSHLVAVTFPEPGDTPEAFAALVQVAGIPERRLVDLAAYAPQWARFVEYALGWPGFEDATWWLHAHTRDVRWSISSEILETWKAEIQQRTPLLGEDLLEGAADVAWFWQAYTALGEERWNALDRAAPYTGSAGGHKRAQLFADAMRGRVDKARLLARIGDKRHQDSVRALGLLPLAEGDGREADVLERYGAIQEFVRTSARFGAQRRENEKLAARIALDNLARTAGFPDPQRLEWAMEAGQSEDLASGPQSVTVGEVTVSLALDDLGRPALAVEKGGRSLKSIPAAAKKDPAVAALRARARDLERQVSRTRHSLEQAMCRGDTFTGAELRRLADHPVLAPMIEHLVFSGDGVIGYPLERGQALQGHDGRLQPLGPDDRVRLAHPTDFSATKEWHCWQRECFLAERIQPFKQVFRELYVLTETECAEGTISRRYAGHQVNPRQALALLSGRGWVSHPDQGVYRIYHDWGISAWLESPIVWSTPAEVEGLTIEGVYFTRRGEWQQLSLADVPPRLFSEVMRDVDLVVSVAHQGGVDPEASASTVEMRAGLLTETCAALRLNNVRLQGSRALIEGRLASYSVHMGSAVVHQQPGGHLCIIPVHGQHRGRIFLPFADDDPKTAELLSKVLLLARDGEIKDPTILEQILAGR